MRYIQQKMQLTWALLVTLCLSAAGCSSFHQTPDEVKAAQSGRQVAYPGPATYGASRPMFIQNYVDGMADALVAYSRQNFKLGRTAIGSITLIDSLDIEQDANHPLAQLGNQVQESLNSSLAQRGYSVVEYRRSQHLIIHPDHEQMLTRDLTKLADSENFNYFLTGTIKYQENGAVVNLRVIELEGNEVIAATTKLIPLDVFWDTRQVRNVNGYLYRDTYGRTR